MTDVACKYEFIPREQWNQDPVYKTYARLFIGDILAMLPYRTGPDDAFAYKNHPIYKVDILGLVVSVAEREKFFTYAVDDGTGVLRCCCWKSKKNEESSSHPKHHRTARDAESVLASCLERRMEDTDADMLTPCDLGDLIHVRGRVKIFRGNMEMSASYFKKIVDPTFQTEMRWMEELPLLYQSVYDQPFVLPGNARQRMAQQEEEARLGLRREANLISEVQEKLMKLLDEKTITNFYLQELETVRELLDVAALPCVEYQQAPSSGAEVPARQIKSIFRGAVEKLEHDGKVFRSRDEQGLFQGVHGNSQLNDAILQILRSDCQQPKYEGGCHYLHVMDRLRNMPRYELIGPDAVKEALVWLEFNSQVVSTTQKHYIAIT